MIRPEMKKEESAYINIYSNKSNHQIKKKSQQETAELPAKDTESSSRCCPSLKHPYSLMYSSIDIVTKNLCGYGFFPSAFWAARCLSLFSRYCCSEKHPKKGGNRRKKIVHQTFYYWDNHLETLQWQKWRYTVGSISSSSTGADLLSLALCISAA